MATDSSQALKIFYCYAREDQVLRGELHKALSGLDHITAWYDGEIIPGKPWEEEIEKHLNEADVILLLISPDFLASNYCYSKEMKRAIERHNTKAARVISILLRPVHWPNTPLSNMQALPSNGESITTWLNKDKAFEDVAKGIDRVVQELRPQQITPPPVPPIPGRLRLHLRSNSIITAALVVIAIFISIGVVFSNKTAPAGASVSTASSTNSPVETSTFPGPNEPPPQTILKQPVPYCSGKDGWTVPPNMQEGTGSPVCSASGFQLQQNSSSKSHFGEMDLESVNGNQYNQTNFKATVAVTFTQDDIYTYGCLIIQTPAGHPGGYILCLNNRGSWQLQDGTMLSNPVAHDTINTSPGSKNILTMTVQSGLLSCAINGQIVVQPMKESVNDIASDGLTGLIVEANGAIQSAPVSYTDFELDAMKS